MPHKDAALHPWGNWSKGLRSGSGWFETTTSRGYLSGKHYILMGLRLFKIGVAGLNPASARGGHKCLSHLMCLILPVGLCEILPLRKPSNLPIENAVPGVI